MARERAKVSYLRGLPSNPITYEAFDGVVRSEQTITRVGNSIAKLCKLRNYAVVNPIYVGYSFDDKRAYGSVQHIPPSQGVHDLIGVGTTLSFPRSLYEQTDLSADQLMAVAADFVQAYGIFLRGQSKNHRTTKHSFIGSQHAELWEPVYSIQPAKAVPYRAAALVALQGLQPDARQPQALHLSGEMVAAPFPAHMAALQNPLVPNEMQALHEEMKKGA